MNPNMKPTIMRTYIFPIVLLVPLFCLGQNAPIRTHPILEKAELCLTQEKYDSAIALANKIILQTRPDARDVRQALFIKGKALFETGEPEASIKPLHSSLSLSQKYKDEPLQLNCMIVLAAAHGDMNEEELDSTTYYLGRALSLSKVLRDTIAEGKIYSNLANLYMLSREYELALKHNDLFDALLEKRPGVEKERAINQHSRGNSLLELYTDTNEKKYLSGARNAYEKALDLISGLQTERLQGTFRTSLAQCLLYFEDIDGAKKEIKHSIRIGMEFKDSDLLFYNYYALANLYEMNGETAALIHTLDSLAYYLGKVGKASDIDFVGAQFGNGFSNTTLALIESKKGIFKKQLENAALAEKNRRNSNIIIGLLLGLAVLLVFLWQQRRLAAQKERLLRAEIDHLTQTREVEFVKARLEGETHSRHRLAQQIHDGVGGLLISTKWNLEAALDEMPRTNERAYARLLENLRLQENSYLELRRVMYELAQNEKPWWEQLQQFCEQIKRDKRININCFTHNLDESVGGKLGEEIRLITQELITNALKHANATEISVQLSLVEGMLDVIVEDNGKGFDRSTVVEGIGLKSMEERLARLGGNLIIETIKDSGAIVCVELLLKPPNPQDRTVAIHASAN